MFIRQSEAIVCASENVRIVPKLLVCGRLCWVVVNLKIFSTIPYRMVLLIFKTLTPIIIETN